MSPQDAQRDEPTADRTAAAEDGERATGEPGPDPDVGQGLLEVDMGPSSALAHLYRGEVTG